MLPSFLLPGKPSRTSAPQPHPRYTLRWGGCGGGNRGRNIFYWLLHRERPWSSPQLPGAKPLLQVPYFIPKVEHLLKAYCVPGSGFRTLTRDASSAPILLARQRGSERLISLPKPLWVPRDKIQNTTQFWLILSTTQHPVVPQYRVKVGLPYKDSPELSLS